MTLNIRIQTIEHNKQRYPTCGDWEWSSLGNLNIYVSNMGDWRKELCIAVHELTEAFLCRERNITQEEVDTFDKTYEANRSSTDLTSEPGDDPSAPYKEEHFFATNLERLLAYELGLDWSEYEKAIQSL